MRPFVRVSIECRYIAKKIVHPFHPDKNVNTQHNTPMSVDYFVAFTSLAVTIDDLLRNFFHFLERQACRMTAGIPEPRPLYRPNGKLAVIPDRAFSTKHNTMFAEAKLQYQPDEFLPTRSRHDIPDVFGVRPVGTAVP